LLRYGALYSDAAARHEYWRFVAHGFLHADVLHLASNMLCLILWGAHLERRVGAFYFLTIYLFALATGGFASMMVHASPFFVVGASGATSGILGALLALTILGRVAIPANFFVANIGLNIVLALGVTRIDWVAHLGGFAGGMIACALLDIAEKIAPHALQCKFPEFVKINGGFAIALLASYAWQSGLIPQVLVSIRIVILIIVALLAVKIADLMLSARRGLALIVGAFAVINAAAVLMLQSLLSEPFATVCKASNLSAMSGAIVYQLCSNPALIWYSVSTVVFVLTVLLLWREFIRGLNDVGFVAATLTAERRRRNGL
jgi:rhomboid protease GluP